MLRNLSSCGVLVLVLLSACAVERDRTMRPDSGTTRPDTGTTADSGRPDTRVPPRPIDACPAGGTLRTTVVAVVATPRKPSGEPWDGVSDGTQELLCDVLADFAREQILARFGAAATVLDESDIAERVEGAIADLCGLAANWATARFEGPDMFALGGFGDEIEETPLWRSYYTPDSWSALTYDSDDGGFSGWDVPCDAAEGLVYLNVIDRDVAFDDPVGAFSLDLKRIPDDVICGGWGIVPGIEGLAAVLLRFDVLDVAPYCGD